MSDSNWISATTTSFFQEMHHFNFLAETVVSDLKAGAFLGRNKNVRVWSAACSTGEEPYSIAISLQDALRYAPSSEPATDQPGGWRIEVLASDIDTVDLATAEDRIYNEESLTEVSAAARKRYFLRGTGAMDGRVRVRKELADLIHFRHVNLNDSNWAVEGSFDVIFFRNALENFDQEKREPLLRKMLRYLKPHAYLILGDSDHVPWLSDAVLPIGNSIHQLRPHGKAKYTGGERRTKRR